MSDLIRREDAFKAILGETIYDTVDDVEIHCDASVADSEGWLGGIRNALRAIEYVPSAEPERKKGKWTGDCCSCCGVSKYNYIKMVDDECAPFGTWNFCPNCGADMRGE